MSPKPVIRVKKPAAATFAAATAGQEEPAVAVSVEEPLELEEETVAETVSANGTESAYDDLGIDDLRNELTGRGLDATGRRSVLVERLEADDAKPKVAAKPTPKTVAMPKPAAPAPKPAVAPKPAAPAPTAPKPVSVAPKVAPKPIPPQPPAEEEKSATGQTDGGANAVVTTTFKELLEVMGTGMSIVIVKEGKNEWTMTLIETKAVAKTEAVAKAATPGPKFKGDAYWKEVLSPEYWTWSYEDAGNGKSWVDMTPEEKNEYAETLGVTWDRHEDVRVNAIRQVSAILKHLEIPKYKPEYQDSKVRDALRG